MDSTVRELGGTKGALPRSLLKDVADWRPAGLFDPHLLLADNLAHRHTPTGEAAENSLCDHDFMSLQLGLFPMIVREGLEPSDTISAKELL
jgi:hypothetical protein